MRVIKGKTGGPRRVYIYGDVKTGKSTLAAEYPGRPIFVDVEDGLTEIDCERLPLVKSWKEFIECVNWVYEKSEGYGAIAIDTINAAERLLMDHVAKVKKKKSFEDFQYGAGHRLLVAHMRKLISLFEKIQREKKMTIIIVGHSEINRRDNPEGEDYSRVDPELSKKVRRLFTQWCTEILLVRQRVVLVEKSDKTNRAYSTGAIEIRTKPTATYAAGNRLGLADPIQPSELWENMVTPDPEKLAAQAEILKKTCALPERCARLLEKAGRDTGRLIKVIGWLEANQIIVPQPNTEEESDSL